MTDTKARLGHLAVLAHGPVLNWPHLADVAADAIDRIASLEAKVRFYERKVMNTAVGEQNAEQQ